MFSKKRIKRILKFKNKKHTAKNIKKNKKYKKHDSFRKKLNNLRIKTIKKHKKHKKHKKKRIAKKKRKAYIHKGGQKQIIKDFIQFINKKKQPNESKIQKGDNLNIRKYYPMEFLINDKLSIKILNDDEAKNTNDYSSKKEKKIQEFAMKKEELKKKRPTTEPPDECNEDSLIRRTGKDGFGMWYSRDIKGCDNTAYNLHKKLSKFLSQSNKMKSKQMIDAFVKI
uniref:Uncharacterized protein n=1 Tax=viral metagenome TaxID=1070528 RepID=A0A6C0LXF0_9ZZZZ